VSDDDKHRLDRHLFRVVLLAKALRCWREGQLTPVGQLGTGS
jgi:hypothetical protein